MVSIWIVWTGIRDRETRAAAIGRVSGQGFSPEGVPRLAESGKSCGGTAPVCPDASVAVVIYERCKSHRGFPDRNDEKKEGAADLLANDDERPESGDANLADAALAAVRQWRYNSSNPSGHYRVSHLDFTFDGR